MTRRVAELTAWAWLVGFCLITASCSSSGDAPPPIETIPRAASPAGQSSDAAQAVIIELRSQPDPPKSGDNTFDVTVSQPDGSPVIDATVTTVFSMPAMPSMNMPAMRSTATLAHEASGRYRGTGQLSMSGTWNVTVTVSHGVEEIGRKNFSIVAK